MDIPEPASGSSHLAEKLYLLHQQPGRTVQEMESARSHATVNGVKSEKKSLRVDPLVTMRVLSI